MSCFVPPRERPHHLQIVRADDAGATAAVASFDAKIDGDAQGTMQEYPDVTGRGPTLFRYTGRDGVQSAHTVPPGRLTDRVRLKLWELVEAIEDEGLRAALKLER